jgi:hypothetical protein
MEKMIQGQHQGSVFQIQGTRTLLIQMSGRKRQSKHTRKLEEGSQYYHLLHVQAEGTLHQKMHKGRYSRHQ